VPPYVGRFAPSPSGPLHAGSLVAAMASYLDARAHAGIWRVRIEDVDIPRTVEGADQVILHQLAALGMRVDGDIWYQSRRDAVYQRAFAMLDSMHVLYGCACTRREIVAAARAAGIGEHVQEVPYLGHCRDGLPEGRGARAWRVRMPAGDCTFEDRWLGSQTQDVARAVGDVAIRRADGLWAYQLAVVVDDAAQGISHVVRGADLLSSTARQIRLGEWLQVPRLHYMHVPLVMDPESGLKLSKQNHAPALNISQPLQTLQQAFGMLGFAPVPAQSVAAFWQAATTAWATRFKVA